MANSSKEKKGSKLTKAEIRKMGKRASDNYMKRESHGYGEGITPDSPILRKAAKAIISKSTKADYEKLSPSRKKTFDNAAEELSRATGMAKGGLVKANCGASMKPTQKSSKKK